MVVKYENVRIPWNVTDFGSITNGEIKIHLLINLKDNIFDMAVGTSPNLARMCG